MVSSCQQCKTLLQYVNVFRTKYLVLWLMHNSVCRSLRIGNAGMYLLKWVKRCGLRRKIYLCVVQLGNWPPFGLVLMKLRARLVMWHTSWICQLLGGFIMFFMLANLRRLRAIFSLSSLLRLMVMRSLRLRRFWICGFIMGIGSFYVSGKDTGSMKILGLMSTIWEMLSRFYVSFCRPFLGSKGPEGGVVLGIDLHFGKFM